MLPSNLKTIDTALCETIVQSTSINSTLMGPMNYPVGWIKQDAEKTPKHIADSFKCVTTCYVSKVEN